MAVKIRLRRMGRKNQPYYRIVVTDSHAPRDGRYIESIGHYRPIVHPPEIEVNEERAVFWMDQGAIPSETIRSIFRQRGMLLKRYMVKKGWDESRQSEELKKWELLQLEREKRKQIKVEEKRKAEGKSEQAADEAVDTTVKESGKDEQNAVVEENQMKDVKTASIESTDSAMQNGSNAETSEDTGDKKSELKPDKTETSS